MDFRFSEEEESFRKEDTTLFLRRGKQYQFQMGDSGYWEDVIAAELLDR